MEQCFFPFDLHHGLIEQGTTLTRHLSDLRGLFADKVAYNRALTQDDPVIYTVSKVEFMDGDGQLHCGLGKLSPGKIGAEYYFTKGHLHLWRAAAEIYVGLEGEGCMLLEDETSGTSQMVPLRPNVIIYVPGNTAHRTVNTGSKPLKYLGIYPAQAGRDIRVGQGEGFHHVIIEVDGKPKMLDRRQYLRQIGLTIDPI